MKDETALEEPTLGSRESRVDAKDQPIPLSTCAPFNP